MQKSQAIGEQMNAARQLEAAGRLADAAAIYQKLFNGDPANEQVIARLLVMYRKLKDYRKELSVLEDAIAAYQRRQKAAQKNWIQAHPQAAGAGRSILRQLEKGGYPLTGLGGNSVLERWTKRQQLVTGRITGKKGKKIAPKGGKVRKIAPRTQARVLPLRPKEMGKRQQRQEAATLRQQAARDRREAAASKKREERERKAAEATRRKEAQEQKKAELLQRKAEAARLKAEAAQKKEEAQRHPSLFIILLEYLVDLDEIDALMKQHIAYLKKHYDSGDFLVSGRRVPRTGGVILARAKDRRAMERTMQQDPFIKRKLASAELIEFNASQVGRGLEDWFRQTSDDD